MNTVRNHFTFHVSRVTFHESRLTFVVCSLLNGTKIAFNSWILDGLDRFCQHFQMGFLEQLTNGFSRTFRRQKLYSMQSADLKMWQASSQSGIRPVCGCFDAQYGKEAFQELELHAEQQDTNCEGWASLNDLIGKAASKGNQEFAPGLELPVELWSQIITLPPSISQLTSVRKLYLYGSHLVRLPPEIGEMASLEELDLYTSHRLHWVPYEVTRCRKLVRSRISTRTLYGNYKYRAPFPKLGGAETKTNLPRQCSVCGRALETQVVHQVWISFRIATDVLPLLVNACSYECISRLPPPAYGYVEGPHTGGLGVQQPPAGFVPPHPDRKWTLG